MQERNDHRIHHHVQLPSGRQIEVVYLDSHEAQAPSAGVSHACNETPLTAAPWTGSSPTAPKEELHICPRCAGKLVNPLDWTEQSPGRWRILMRCPDCDLVREGVFGETLVERLDEELDRATGALLGDLKQLTYANMVEEIELFSRALELDLIGPSDF